jgi:hypothetical protein
MAGEVPQWQVPCAAVLANIASANQSRSEVSLFRILQVIQSQDARSAWRRCTPVAGDAWSLAPGRRGDITGYAVGRNTRHDQPSSSGPGWPTSGRT